MKILKELLVYSLIFVFGMFLSYLTLKLAKRPHKYHFYEIVLKEPLYRFEYLDLYLIESKKEKAEYVFEENTEYLLIGKDGNIFIEIYALKEQKIDKFGFQLNGKDNVPLFTAMVAGKDYEYLIFGKEQDAMVSKFSYDSDFQAWVGFTHGPITLDGELTGEFYLDINMDGRFDARMYFDPLGKLTHAKIFKDLV
jgi:hypothetical protein